jgi:hypothetical protein
VPDDGEKASGALSQIEVEGSVASVISFARLALACYFQLNFSDIVVDFNPELEAHLRDMKTRRVPDSDFLLPGRGEEGSIGSVRKSLELVREQAGFEKFGFHDCRHTFISYCIMSGVDILTVAKWVGHSDGGVLIGKVYGHLATEHRQRAAQKGSFDHDQPRLPTKGNLVDLSKLSPETLLQAILQLQQAKHEPLEK